MFLRQAERSARACFVATASLLVLKGSVHRPILLRILLDSAASQRLANPALPASGNVCMANLLRISLSLLRKLRASAVATRAALKCGLASSPFRTPGRGRRERTDRLTCPESKLHLIALPSALRLATKVVIASPAATGESKPEPSQELYHCIWCPFLRHFGEKAHADDRLAVILGRRPMKRPSATAGLCTT